MKYHILSYTNPSKLKEEVDKLLSKGYKLQGGISVIKVNPGYLYTQALTQKIKQL